MKQEPDEPKDGRPRVGDEGARYTKQLMAEVTRLRNSKGPKWSAERLAQEMAAVGVPWTRNSVVNLESGRRKHIAAHEVLALAWVLGVRSPIDLFAPEHDSWVQVLPKHFESRRKVRAWFEGDPELLQPRRADPDGLAEFLREIAPEVGMTADNAESVAHKWAARQLERNELLPPGVDEDDDS
jgi:hypothetical protein